MRNTMLAALAAVALAGGTGCVGMHGMGCTPQMACGAACSDCTSCGSCDAGCASCESTWDGYCAGDCGCSSGACTSCGDGCSTCGGGLFAELHAKHAAKHAGGFFSLHHGKHGNYCDDGYGNGVVNGAGAVAYPYYTTRGPRDFLACEPRTIGR